MQISRVWSFTCRVDWKPVASSVPRPYRYVAPEVTFASPPVKAASRYKAISDNDLEL